MNYNKLMLRNGVILKILIFFLFLVIVTVFVWTRHESNLYSELFVQKVIFPTSTKAIEISLDEWKSNYENNLKNYLKKWQVNLNSGKSVLQTYMSLLDDTHKIMVEEQWLPPFNVTKRPIPLKQILNCSNPIFSSFLRGTVRTKPGYVIDVILIGYELVLLEMRLFELYESVDEFVVFESNITFKRLPKPFFFFDNLNRFKRFLDKITLVTPFNISRFYRDGSIKSKIEINDEDIFKYFKTRVNYTNEKLFYTNDYSIETDFRMLPINLFKKYVRDYDLNDVFIHGDTDEIPDGNVINHFKHCDVKNELYPFAIWSTFYIYSFSLVFKSDFPSPTDPYSFKYPNILVYNDIKKNNFTRLQKTFLLPAATGCHLNRILRTIVLGIYKEMSQSDGLGVTEYYNRVLKNGDDKAIDEFKKLFSSGKIQSRWEDRVYKLSSFNGQLKVFVPWIVLENKHIYTNFF